MMGLILLLFVFGVSAWTSEIHGRFICDVCGDSYLGPEDHVVEGFPLSLSLMCFVSICVVLIEFLEWCIPFLMKIVCFLLL